ncbi:vitamin K epoxide reductase family protein [Actinomadura darangshiensis]|uniref:Vitamin K epoxide reductase family protein n=1 Tax=Actinomadura darangshiensis TaxID=705336 RepID=A0A4R5AJU8_9ACTN|nr:vitamin K epoxide reductase family protein [Actinomadura darangshiensis]TDD72881.1 vitamin K epoxide reductase family protein [Actinomadura darangshiensis]
MTQEMTAKDRARTAPPALPPAWLQAAAWLLTLAGLGISVYLTVTHYDEGALVCSATKTVDCHAVTTSEYSTLLGIPMPLLGLAFFVGFAALLTPWALRSAWPPLRWARVAGVAVGVLMVVYLVTVELAILHKICLWCTGVHVITVLLFILVLIDEFRRIGQVD